MIDGIKILNLPVNINDLFNNELLVFPLPVNDRDGEILDTPRTATYKGLIFTIKNNNVRLKGSLHKYFNKGLHNYNDFYYSNLFTVITDLWDKFQINPLETILNNVEFGVNINLNLNPDILLNSIINHRGTPFHPFTIEGAKGIECIHSDYYIKIYNKSHQYNLKNYILRFEIKVKRMKFFTDNEINLKYLSDLLNRNVCLKLGTILTSVFNEILCYDNTINLTKINARGRLILSNGCNPKFWEELNPDSKQFTGGNENPEYKRKRKKYYRELNKFKTELLKFSSSTMQKNISLLIENKWNELSNFDNITGDKLTDLLNSCSNNKRDKLTDIQTDFENSKKGQINILNIVGICPPTPQSETRLCLTCKTDISHKRKTAKYCSKKCKNDYTNPLLNPKNNLRRRVYKHCSNVLFDCGEGLRLSREQEILLNTKNTIYRRVQYN